MAHLVAAANCWLHFLMHRFVGFAVKACLLTLEKRPKQKKLSILITDNTSAKKRAPFKCIETLMINRC